MAVVRDDNLVTNLCNEYYNTSIVIHLISFCVVIDYFQTLPPTDVRSMNRKLANKENINA
jgi:hypothetical protein